MTEVLAGTKKGLMVLRGDAGSEMDVVHRAFPGEEVEFALRDPRSGRYLASVTSGFYGPHLHIADDPAGEWRDTGLAFPADTGATLEKIWVIETGAEEGVLWAGVAPAALFKSTDGGESWELVRSLWDHPTRPDWQPGGGGLCLHSICPWPGEPDKLALGISAAGVWLTNDGCATWTQGNKGIVPGYMPEEQRGNTMQLCIHHIERAPSQPETLYMQFHGGVYRSDDAGESWNDIGVASGLPVEFGFPIAIDPADPDRAFIVPLKADLDRVTPEGRVTVYETRDRGASWEARTDGLPQDDAYLTILRQAFTYDRNSPVGLYFGATSGDLYSSGDAGQTWARSRTQLPPVLSVRATA